MYILLLVLGVLLIVGGVMTLVRAPRQPTNVVWGIILIILGLIAIPGGLSVR